MVILYYIILYYIIIYYNILFSPSCSFLLLAGRWLPYSYKCALLRREGQNLRTHFKKYFVFFTLKTPWYLFPVQNFTVRRVTGLWEATVRSLRPTSILYSYIHLAWRPFNLNNLHCLNIKQFFLFLLLWIAGECANCVDESVSLAGNRWTMPLLKLGEKRYYLGIFFKVRNRPNWLWSLLWALNVWPIV